MRTFVKSLALSAAVVLLASGIAAAQIIGDTLTVGWSALDNQHNMVIGHTIAYNPHGNGGTGEAIVVYTELNLSTTTRLVKANKVHFTDGGLELLDQNGYMISGGQRGGYATIGMATNMDDPFPVIAYHDRTQSGAAWTARVASEATLVPGFFFEQVLPSEAGNSVTQMKIAMDGDSVAHLVGGYSLGDNTGTRPLLYYRLAVDREANSFAVTNPNGMPSIITQLAPYSAGDIAVSPDGQRVAISHAIGRSDLGTSPEPSGADYIIWLSENRGLDWDFENSMLNVTQFQGPDPLQLPDTLAADVDTFRTTAGEAMFFDEDNVLHFAFETYPYFHYEDVGYIFGRVYYWNETAQQMIQVADGSFFLNAAPTSYGSMVGKPSLYKDPDTGYLWCMYQQFGEPGDTLADGTAMDAAESSGKLNADLYIAASPPGEFNGLLWYKGVNITNTKGTTGNLAAGDSRHERDASFALNNDGDYLNILYLQDRDGGNYDNGNGTITNNPLIYQRVSKQELLDMYAANEEFVRNYPLHIDSTGFWQDELDWAWRDLTSVEDEESASLPSSFAIEQTWPNPFNATLSVRFHLPGRERVRLAVYDVLGREAARLADRPFAAGSHSMTFDASGLSSGIYFLRLMSEKGDSRTAKIVLVK